MREQTGDRLARLLAMVAFLSDRDGASVADLAAHFGVSQAQVLRDVDTLWVSGTPGYLPDDLIDFSVDRYDERYIALTNARGMDRPLRLEPAEAVSLVVALRALRALPGMDTPAIESLLHKLTVAAGDAAPAEETVVIEPELAAEIEQHVAGVLSTVRQALESGRRLALSYVSASDTLTRRMVEPIDLASDGEHWYLRAWCLLADGLRHFRLDRVMTCVLTDEPITGRARADRGRTDVADSLRPRAITSSRLTLTPRSRWVAERFGGTVLAERPGAIEVELGVADPAWLDALVLELGSDVLALEPEPSRVAAKARQALAGYEIDEEVP